MARFAGKVVLITGTGGNQGRVAASSFAREGARVMGCDVAAAASKETTRLVRETGGEMHSVEPLDIGDPVQAERWVGEAISRWGRVDVLYNNASSLARSTFEESTLEDWEHTLRGELTIYFVAAKAVWPHFVSQRSGVIVSTASYAGHLEIPVFPCVAHGVANAGIRALTRMLAAAGAPHGVRAVSISPGPVLNQLGREPYNDADSPQMRVLTDHVPLRRPAEAQEVVNTAMFLASDDASYITGADIAVDGGATGIIWR